jgi:hypothetical protein
MNTVFTVDIPNKIKHILSLFVFILYSIETLKNKYRMEKAIIKLFLFPLFKLL